jgi:hypothetical protein
MKQRWTRWPRRFGRWLFGGPFRELPDAYGSTVPPELRRFAAEAEEAGEHGVGNDPRSVPVQHAKTRPARDQGWLERQ